MCAINTSYLEDVVLPLGPLADSRRVMIACFPPTLVLPTRRIFSQGSLKNARIFDFSKFFWGFGGFWGVGVGGRGGGFWLGGVFFWGGGLGGKPKKKNYPKSPPPKNPTTRSQEKKKNHGSDNNPKKTKKNQKNIKK